MKINFTNQTKLKVKEYEKLILEVFSSVRSNVTFSIIFVDADEIKRINKVYRNIDRITDVISFALIDGESEQGIKTNDIGDVFICLERAFEQATDYGHSVAREIGFLAVHGYLHLCGYDHMNKEDEEIMFAKQEEILLQANLKRGN